MNELKTELLKQIVSEFDILPNGRKSRSDKGKARGPNDKVRSDKGLQRQTGLVREDAPTKTYLSLLNRLLNREIDPSQPDDIVVKDQNGIYELLKKTNTCVYDNHTVINRSVKKSRTVKHRQGRTIDLERYRWDALQYLANAEPLGKIDRDEFKIEAKDTRSEVWSDLFSRLYHLSIEDIGLWHYETWRKDYMIVKMDLLNEQFMFSYKFRVGSEQFMPELRYKVEKLNKLERLMQKSTQAYKITYARVRDLTYQQTRLKVMDELLRDPRKAGFSSQQLQKIANSEIEAQREKLDILINEKADQIYFSKENHND